MKRLMSFSSHSVAGHITFYYLVNLTLGVAAYYFWKQITEQRFSLSARIRDVGRRFFSA